MPENPKVAALKRKLSTDPIARANFISETVKYYESIGIRVTPDMKRKLADPNVADRIGKVARTAIIITVF